MAYAASKSSIISYKNSNNYVFKKIGSGVSAFVGILMLIGGIMILISMPFFIEETIRYEQQLVEQNSLFRKWKYPEYNISLNVWSHSITNPDQITKGEKPKVINKGPYVFDEKQYKKIISRGNGTIKYRNFMNFYYNQNRSCSDCNLENDHVWIPNLVYQKFVDAALNPSMKVASTALQLQTPFLDVKTKELFFVGYVDPFLSQICSLPFMSILCESLLNMPERIGLFYERNNTFDGEYIVRDGSQDKSRTLGKIIAWNGDNHLPPTWWSKSQASLINGTDGGLLHPYVSKNEKIYIFSTFICRSIYLIFEKEIDYHGVTGYRFVAPTELFDWTRPENEGFCHENTKKYFDKQVDKCMPNGIMDLSRCLKGNPDIVASMPNFFGADEYVQNSVEGMNVPNAETDQIFIDVEPRLGTLLRASRKLQINFAVRSGENISNFYYPKMKSNFIPVMSLRENVEIGKNNLQEIKDRLLNVERLIFWACVCSSVIGGILTITGVILYCKFRRSMKYSTTSSIHPSSQNTPQDNS
uniref:CD36 family protein n=1 Tax=Parastrongyloides trichosuri TaxID=131310 RepID=A0A0N4ZVG3_PARTI